jgi:hypothetical protein
VSKQHSTVKALHEYFAPSEEQPVLLRNQSTKTIPFHWFRTITDTLTQDIGSFYMPSGGDPHHRP